jgi:hypothetical protein
MMGAGTELVVENDQAGTMARVATKLGVLANISEAI